MSKTYKELIKDRDELDKAIATALETEKAAAIASVRETIELFNLTAKDCGFKSSRTKKQSTEEGSKQDGRSAPILPKYRNPKNPEETWKGRGPKEFRPQWVKDHLAAGGTLDELLIEQK